MYFFSILFPGTVIQTIAQFFDTQISNVCKTGINRPRQPCKDLSHGLCYLIINDQTY